MVPNEAILRIKYTVGGEMGGFVDGFESNVSFGLLFVVWFWALHSSE